MVVSSHLLRHDEHRYVTETAKSPWSSGRPTIRHDSRPPWSSNCSWARLSKNGIVSSLYEALLTGSKIGGASFAIRAYDLVYRLPWLQSQNPDVD
jgi:hypothetical protein